MKIDEMKKIVEQPPTIVQKLQYVKFKTKIDKEGNIKLSFAPLKLLPSNKLLQDIQNKRMLEEAYGHSVFENNKEKIKD